MMSDLYWLTGEQMACIQSHFRSTMAGSAPMTGGF